jgi:hypothetical protein
MTSNVIGAPFHPSIRLEFYGGRVRCKNLSELLHLFTLSCLCHVNKSFGYTGVANSSCNKCALSGADNGWDHGVTLKP